MRIIAGTKRGMKLLPPGTMETRPITDRVKESLFSILYKYNLPDNSVVADIFCGTGSMGLEALSRGARHVNFVELNPKVVDRLNKNIEKASFLKESRTIKANAFKVGAAIRLNEEKCDLAFVDPPYRMSLETSEKSRLGKLLFILNEQMKEGAVVSVRTDKHARLLDQYGYLRRIDHRQWGSMCITLLQLQSKTNDDE